jgi:hypothetical protein
MIHEAAHAVAAILLGLPVISLGIEHNKPHLYRGAFKQTANLAVESLAIISLAGGEAERLLFPQATDFGDAMGVRSGSFIN